MASDEGARRVVNRLSSKEQRLQHHRAEAYEMCEREDDIG
jgi:hypothetical protein